MTLVMDTSPPLRSDAYEPGAFAFLSHASLKREENPSVLAAFAFVSHASHEEIPGPSTRQNRVLSPDVDLGSIAPPPKRTHFEVLCVDVDCTGR